MTLPFKDLEKETMTIRFPAGLANRMRVAAAASGRNNMSLFVSEIMAQHLGVPIDVQPIAERQGRAPTRADLKRFAAGPAPSAAS